MTESSETEYVLTNRAPEFQTNIAFGGSLTLAEIAIAAKGQKVLISGSDENLELPTLLLRTGAEQVVAVDMTLGIEPNQIGKQYNLCEDGGSDEHIVIYLHKSQDIGPDKSRFRFVPKSRAKKYHQQRLKNAARVQADWGGRLVIFDKMLPNPQFTNTWADQFHIVLDAFGPGHYFENNREGLNYLLSVHTMLAPGGIAGIVPLSIIQHLRENELNVGPEDNLPPFTETDYDDYEAGLTEALNKLAGRILAMQLNVTGTSIKKQSGINYLGGVVIQKK